jgi:hypothetical protein
LTSLFKKPMKDYYPYIFPVPEVTFEKVAKIKGGFISADNSSVPAISVGTEGTVKGDVNLTFSNPNNNLSAETPFTFQLQYKQDAINNKITIIQQAKFIPLSGPKVTTTIPGSISVNAFH